MNQYVTGTVIQTLRERKGIYAKMSWQNNFLSAIKPFLNGKQDVVSQTLVFWNRLQQLCKYQLPSCLLVLML